jgi:hypothetical protein
MNFISVAAVVPCDTEIAGAKMIPKHASIANPNARLILLCAGAVALVSMVASQAHAGKLKQLRKETRGSSSDSSDSSDSSSSSSDSDYDDDGSSGGGGDPVLAFYILTSPWWLPYHLTDDRYGRTWAYPSHPYANGIDGYTRFRGVSRPRTLPDGGQLLGQSGALRLRVEGGVLTSGGPFDQNLQRITLAARASTNFRLEIGTEWTLWTEKLVGGVDHLWLGKADATILFAQSENVQFRSGLGFRFMVDEHGTVPGMNFIYGLDIYPVSPLVISAQAELGSIGGALAGQVRISAGVMLGPVEVFAAYDRLAVNNLVFGGPTVGVRMWR